MMPAGLMLALIFPLAGRLADMIPASIMIVGGLMLFIGGFLWMAKADSETTFWTLVAMVMTSRLGLGFINPSLNASSLKALPPDKVRQGAGVANFMRQLGGAFGINLMVAFFETRTVFHIEALTPTQDWSNSTTAEFLHRVEQLMAQAGLPWETQKAGAYDFLGTVLWHQAQLLSFGDTFLIVGAVAAAALPPAIMLSRSQFRRRPIAFAR